MEIALFAFCLVPFPLFRYIIKGLQKICKTGRQRAGSRPKAAGGKEHKVTQEAETPIKTAEPGRQPAAPADTAQSRPAAEVHIMREKAAQNKTALGRVHRKLLRLMLVSLTVTFIALTVVAGAIIYKVTHIYSTPKTAPAVPQAQNSGGIFIQTAPNSGAAAAFPPKAQAEAAAMPPEQLITATPGEKLEEVSLSGNLLLLRLSNKNSKDKVLLIYDFVKKQPVARIRLAGTE
ncbi:MAG: hypothetical protein DU429_06350 [Candidatus Tokpelaia sp.]|nr:MAG: hypothetical protein DU430_01730 [Candidatus Tokpelaia sp.]KAA6206338.1 MAG: hypothetical protein DU429_06350 [Candidatus Tokpelaia sp.]